MKLSENVCKKLSEPAYWSSISKPSLITYLIYLSQTKDLLHKDKIQSQYVSELTIIKRSCKEMDERHKAIVEALGEFALRPAGSQHAKATAPLSNAMLLYWLVCWLRPCVRKATAPL
ncbi:6590_t:CDS:2 [Ambispora gerdemannii]|uniref:6590_t:CDS:1 n=1 Tax=Ambispora gerdemannii TaxID=144530 RepID=A0A9N9GX45_9GLOM|nr:6590_t:CDS:2 [Ambispora gerdemannii]